MQGGGSVSALTLFFCNITYNNLYLFVTTQMNKCRNIPRGEWLTDMYLENGNENADHSLLGYMSQAGVMAE